jgi:feruloyl esterase
VPTDPAHGVLLALQRWVEEGIPPGATVATKHTDNTPATGVRSTSPLCPCPQTSTCTREGDQTPSSRATPG